MAGTVAPTSLLRRLAKAWRQGNGPTGEDLRLAPFFSGRAEGSDDFRNQCLDGSTTGSSSGPSRLLMGIWEDRNGEVDHGFGDGEDPGSADYPGLEAEDSAAMGRVLVGKLRRVGGINRPSRLAPTGFQDVVVDRHESWVGNPFVGGSTAQLCRAYNLLLIALLLVDDGESWGEEVWRRLQTLPRATGSTEQETARRIATLLNVKVHANGGCRSAAVTSAWLWHHARQLALGRSLRLLCWCYEQQLGRSVPAGVCHAQVLADMLRYLGAGLLHSSRGELRAPLERDDSVDGATLAPLQVGHATLALLPSLEPTTHPGCVALAHHRREAHHRPPEGASAESRALMGCLRCPTDTWGVGPPNQQSQPLPHATCGRSSRPHGEALLTREHSAIGIALSCRDAGSRHTCPLPMQVPARLPAMSGDWAVSDIFSRWPPLIARTLASFCWPLTEPSEVSRLLRSSQVGVVDLVICEFSGAVRDCNERRHGRPTLSIDLRASLIPGVHACVDARLVVSMRPSWNRVYAFPPCTHQTLSDTTSSVDKQADGRTFWGIMFFLWCWSIPATMLMLEHPDTVVPDFFQQPTQRFRTSQLGCADDKRINLFERRRKRLPLVADVGGQSGHRRLHDFADAEARDRHRSSWARFPELVQAVVTAPFDPLDSADTPVLTEVVESFAAAWHMSGRAVPADYQARDAQPSSQEARDYQFVRGKGDGRRPASVVPVSLRGEPGPPLMDAMLVARLVVLASLTVDAFVLMFVAMQTVPLVFAPLNGVEVVGVQFQAPTQRRLALTIATRWADHAISDRSSTFLVGEYDGGARLFASPLNIVPHAGQVASTPGQRRRMLRSGVTAAWCTLAALAGTVTYDAAARTMAACTALRCPVRHLADATALGHHRLSTFTVGTFAARPMVDRITDLPTARSVPEQALARVGMHAQALMDRLRERGDVESLHWADVIRPEELQDVPPGFFDMLPTFLDSRLDGLALTAPYEPPESPRLLPRPRQRLPPSGRCPRTPTDLMTTPTERRYHQCLDQTLSDLACIRDQGVECERHRPHTCVFGQSDLVEWARGIVWDFRRAPAECAVPLDYGAPLRPTLHVDFFERELRHYPNQRILGMIADGVIYQADVELQMVFVPHLSSLPKGFAAVDKELKRLGEKGWYEFYPHPPFTPAYFNAQGTQARKLEKDRPRRTTEGGGPRRDTWDRSGLKVWSINEASKAYHIPQHYAMDSRPEMLEWMASRGLPPSQEQLDAAASNHGTKWGKMYMPTLKMVMTDLAVLSRAARRLNLPIYILGNDVKDYFNHLENAVSELPLMNIAWIDSGQLEADARRRAYSDGQGNRLVFVSERRMGFGIHPNAAIAQELSESIDYIFRRKLDARLDGRLAASDDQAVQAWRRERLALQARVGGHQTRLYAAHTYMDDNVIIVVGMDNALDALDVRGEIERQAGLIMAIPEKRMLGTWGLWLGIYIFAGLGLIVVPRSKLVRASAALNSAMSATLQFDDYQSLMGLLEHIRHASCWPRRIMHGLYRPHGPDGESRRGPATLVEPTPFMEQQLQHWLHLLGTVAGAVVTDAVRRSALPRGANRLQYVGSSDAATDSVPPGLGGYMHGLFWYLALLRIHVMWLHISVLEMLATGFSTIIFGKQLPPGAELVLGADATATATSLTLHSQRSEMLTLAHHELLGSTAFQEAQVLTSLGHLRGDANEAADAVSRAKWATFMAMCRRLRVRPQQLSVPDECHRILDRVLQQAILRGVRVRDNPYVAAPMEIPHSHVRYLPEASLQWRSDAALEHEEVLGAEERSNDLGDGPVYTSLFSGVRQGLTNAELSPELVRVAYASGQTDPRPSTLAAMHAAVSILVARQDGIPCVVAEEASRRGAALRTARLWLAHFRRIDLQAYEAPPGALAAPPQAAAADVGSVSDEPAGPMVLPPGPDDASGSQLVSAESTPPPASSSNDGVQAGQGHWVIPEHDHGWAYPMPPEPCRYCGSPHVVKCVAGQSRQPECGAVYCLICHGGAPPPGRGPARPGPVIGRGSYVWRTAASALVKLRGRKFRSNSMGDGPVGDVSPCGIVQHGLGMHQAFIARMVSCADCGGERCSWCRQGCQCRLSRPDPGYLPDDVEDEDEPDTDDVSPNLPSPALRRAMRIRGGAPSGSVAQPGDLIVVAEMNLAHPDDLILDESDLVRSDDLVLTDSDALGTSFGDLVLTESDLEESVDELHCSGGEELTPGAADDQLAAGLPLPYAPPFGFTNANIHCGADGPVQRAPTFGPGVAFAPPRSIHCLVLARMRASSTQSAGSQWRSIAALEFEQSRGSCFRGNSMGDGPGAFAAAKRKQAPPPTRLPERQRAPSRYWLARHVRSPGETELGMAPVGVQKAVRTKRGVSRMPTVTVGGQTFAAPAGRKERATSLRKLSMLQLAVQRAAKLAAPTADADQKDGLVDAVLATHELAEHGAAYGTLEIDDHAYLFWDRFCGLYGWSPTFDGDAEWIRTHQDEVTQRLAIFQAWVYPQLAGRGGRADAKPRTVFNNYVLAVIRILGREHLPMPKAKLIEKSLAGLMRSFKQIYGVEHLMPGRKQPFTPAMWSKIESMPEQQLLAGRKAWSPANRLRDRTILRLGRVLWRTGHRMGEIVFHPSGEVNYLTRKCVSIRKASGRAIPVPTDADWRALTPGDVVWLAPCPSKSDQFGEEHCPYPSVLPYDGKPDSAAAAVRDIELELPCRPEDRASTPLFCDAQLQPLTYAVMHRELRTLLAALYGERFAAAFSWHSVRIGLACALHAAGCPDPMIQLICRWACPASLKIYRQMGVSENVNWTNLARTAQFDAARVNNIPALDNDERMLQNIQEFAGSPVQPGTPGTPLRAPRDAPRDAPATSYAIPGGTVLATAQDANGLVGLQVGIFNNFWPGYDRGRTKCLVEARCLREFRHPDGVRCLTYLVEYNGTYWPIKHTGLLDCLAQDVRRGLPQQRYL